MYLAFASLEDGIESGKIFANVALPVSEQVPNSVWFPDQPSQVQIITVCRFNFVGMTVLYSIRIGFRSSRARNSPFDAQEDLFEGQAGLPGPKAEKHLFQSET